MAAISTTPSEPTADQMTAKPVLPAIPSTDTEQPISGFNAWLASRMASTKGVKGSMKGMKNVGGPWAGKTPEQATQMAMEEYAALPDEEKARWDNSRESLKVGGMPFGSPVSTGKMGKPLVSGASPTAETRTNALNADAQNRAIAAKGAVQARKDWQAANPAAVVDMNIAAKNENLAHSGITDMGGGTMAMQNKYGTGFAEKLTPEQFAARKPGVIRDEKGTVDMTALKDGKLAYDATEMGAGAIAYGSPTVGTPALNMDAADANRAAIQQKIAAAAPKAADRLAADRAKQIAAMPAAPAPKSTAAAKPAAPTNPMAAVMPTPAQVAPVAARAAAGAISPVLPMAFDAAKALMPKKQPTSNR